MSTNINNKRPKILIVEDDDLLQDLFFDILKQEGYEVDQAFSGEEALAKIVAHQYDVCILDLIFKNTQTQGFEVLKTIHASYPQLPVVVMSGRASDEVVLNTIEEGCFSFIVKPIFDLYLLLHVIRSAAGKNHPSIATTTSTNNIFNARIKGMPVDAHLYLRQYLNDFENYTQVFKGAAVTVASFESVLDDMKVQFTSNHPAVEVNRWLSEYFSFAEQRELVNPLFETPVFHNDALAAVTLLKNTVEHFTTNIEKSSRRNYVDPGFPTSADGQLVMINYQKVLNSVKLRKESAETVAFRLIIKRISDQTQRLIDADQTLEALTGLFEFSHQYELNDLQKDIIQIRAQLNRLMNHNETGKINFQQFSALKDRIHNAVLYDVLVKIETMPVAKRA